MSGTTRAVRSHSSRCRSGPRAGRAGLGREGGNEDEGEHGKRSEAGKGPHASMDFLRNGSGFRPGHVGRSYPRWGGRTSRRRPAKGADIAPRPPPVVLRGVFFEREAVAMEPRVQRLARHLEQARRAALVAVRARDRAQSSRRSASTSRTRSSSLPPSGAPSAATSTPASSPGVGGSGTSGACEHAAIELDTATASSARAPAGVWMSALCTTSSSSRALPGHA